MASDEFREEALSLGIGKKIKEFRKKRGMTLARVGDLSGLSVGLLSQVENDGVVPPIPTLLSIARTLGVRIETFFKDDSDNMRVSVVKRDEMTPERHRRPADVGYRYNALAHRRASKKMEPFLVEFEPKEKEEIKYFSHEGEEFIYVIDGIIEFKSEGQSHILETGDSIYFDSDRPHGVRGVDPKTSRALIMVTD